MNELSKKERRELRREEKRQELAGLSQKKSMKKWFLWALIIIIIVAVGWAIYKSLPETAKIPEIGQSYPEEGRNHVADGVKVNYKTNPPSSGDHYGDPANWGVYEHEIPDEAAVHNLEHGGIWISYRTDVPDATKKKLTEIAKSNTKVILTPRAKNDSSVALVSWRRIYKMEALDENMMQNFILKYKNTGPEQVPDNMPGKAY